MAQTTNKAFLGVGLGWPLAADGDGNLTRAAYEESVRQSIWLILSTAKGERVMRPDFGCGIHELVFGSIGSATFASVAQAVRKALLSFETRINVLDVRVSTAGKGEVLLISMDYEVRATNTAFNLVYPFYLEGSA